MEQFKMNIEAPPENQEHVNKMIDAGKNGVELGNSKFDENGNLISKHQSSVVKPEAQTQEAPLNPNDGQNTSNDIPEKFKDKDGNINVEALLKSYKELEKTKGNTQEPTKETSNNDTPNTETQDKPNNDKPSLKIESVEDAIKIAHDKGIDFTKLDLEFAKNGSLSDETFKMLEEKGITKDVVNSFLEGQQAKATIIRNEILASVGGEDEYNKMVKWAINDLKPEEIAAYNHAMSTNNKGFIDLAVNGLKAKYVAANGQAPNLVSGRSPSTSETNSASFNSQAEMINAMKDPRYINDPSFRAEVLAKIQKGFGK